jgi:phosphohistidine phosphatase
MQIFVLRHGHAAPQQTTDEARKLTEKGRADVISSVSNSVADMHNIKEIWSSSLVRAWQTSCIACDILAAQKLFVPIKVTDLITPEADPTLLFDSLQQANLSSVLLVSHQPFVGKFLDLFCGAPLGTHSMDTSSLAFVECDVAAKGCGDLRWLRHVHG